MTRSSQLANGTCVVTGKICTFLLLCVEVFSNSKLDDNSHFLPYITFTPIPLLCVSVGSLSHGAFHVSECFEMWCVMDVVGLGAF